MARKKQPKNKKTPSATENWIVTKRLTQRDSDLRNLAMVKEREIGKTFKTVKVEDQPRCYKLVEVK